MRVHTSGCHTAVSHRCNVGCGLMCNLRQFRLKFTHTLVRQHTHTSENISHAHARTAGRLLAYAPVKSCSNSQSFTCMRMVSQVCMPVFTSI